MQDEQPIEKEQMPFGMQVLIGFIVFAIIYLILYFGIRSNNTERFMIQVNDTNWYYTNDFVVSNGAITFTSDGNEYTVSFDAKINIKTNNFYKGE